MAVTITTIQGQDSLSSSRLVINQNFSALKAGVEDLQAMLDPSTNTLQNVKSVTINDGAVPLSSSIFQVSKGSSLLGNVTLGTVGATTSVLVNGTGGFTISQGSLSLTTGNLTLSGSSSVLSLSGHLSISKEVRMPGVSTAFSSPVSLTASGSVSVADRKYVVISNDSTTTGLTATLSAGSAGQVLEIFHQLGASGYPVWINASNFSGLTGSIKLNITGDTIRCVYDGASWYLWRYSPASFGLTSGPTGSSIQFTTL